MPTNYVAAASLYLISRMLDAVDGFTARNHFYLNYLGLFWRVNKLELGKKETIEGESKRKKWEKIGRVKMKES